MHIAYYVACGARPIVDVGQQILKMYFFRKNYTHQLLKSLLMFISLPI